MSELSRSTARQIDANYPAIAAWVMHREAHHRQAQRLLGYGAMEGSPITFAEFHEQWKVTDGFR